MNKKGLYFIATLAVTLALAGCASPANPVTTPPITPKATTPTGAVQPTVTPTAQTGTVEVRVTDAPPNQNVTSVMVTVTGVQIHMVGDSPTPTQNTTTTGNATANSTPVQGDSDSGWIPLNITGPSTFDLLKIKGLEQALAVGNLTVGKYTQIRMAVSKVQVALDGGELQNATIPSGKLKFVQPFEVVAGKPTVILFDFDAARSVNITGGNGKIMFKPVIKLSVTKTPGSLEIITGSLNSGEVGIVYNTILNVIGGKAPYIWSVSSGSLPGGLNLNATSGVISGTPTAAGGFDFTLKAEDSTTTGKRSNTKIFSIDVAVSGALQVITTGLPEGITGVVYSATLQAVGGSTPYTWSIASDNLPNGLTLNGASGEISGTPAEKGVFNFTIRVNDSTSPANTDSQPLVLTISKDATE